MLTRPDPIVLQVPATLHLLCSMDVSAWMSHCAEVSLCGRLASRPPSLQASRPSSKKLGLSFFRAVARWRYERSRACMWLMLFPRLCGPDTQNAAVFCEWRFLPPPPPSSALHFLPLSSRRVEQAVTRPPSVLVVSHRGCEMTLLMALLCEVFLPPLTDRAEKKRAATQTCTVALI